MVMGLFRWFRSLIGAVLVLVAGLAISEFALRLQAIPAANTAADQPDCPLAVPSWQTAWELRPSSTERLPSARGEPINFQTNSLGFRGDEVVIPKPQGTFRIVCLGDETLLAPEIAGPETFCELLRAHLQTRSAAPLEVVNAALPHACPLTIWLHFRQRVLALQPDLVLVHVTWADLADDRALRRWTACDRRGVPLSCSHPQLTARAQTKLCEWRQEFRIVNWSCQQVWCRVEQAAPGRATSSIWSNVETLAQSTEFTQMLQPLEPLAQLCESGSGRCVVWTTPEPWQISGTATAEGSARSDAGVPANGLISSRTPFEMLSRTLAGWRIPCLDASGAFPVGSGADRCFLPDKPRWTAEGHRHVARFVAVQIAEHLPGPWSAPYSQPQTVPASYTQAPPGSSYK
jgi:hypothetical protein